LLRKRQKKSGGHFFLQYPVYILEKFSLYFTHLPRSPQWTDLHEILHGGSSRGRNHLFQILCRLVKGFGSARGRILPFSIDLAGRH